MVTKTENGFNRSVEKLVDFRKNFYYYHYQSHAKSSTTNDGDGTGKL